MMSKRISKSFEDLYKQSQRSRSSQIIYGLLAGLIVWLTGIVLALIINPFIGNNTFIKTFLNDLPGVSLVFGLVILLELWGIIPLL